jgi:hypothetical protein
MTKTTTGDDCPASAWRRTAWRWARRALCILGLSALVADGGLRQDELDCEEAVSYLQGCCPDFGGATVACVHDVGCQTGVETALSIEESQCILAESCDQVMATGLCEKVKNLPSPMVNGFDPSQATSHPPVCP